MNLSEFTSASVFGDSRPTEYQVVLGNGLLTHLPDLLREYAPAHRYAVISDHTVSGLYGDKVIESIRGSGLEAELFSFPSGESYKTRAQWADITDNLLRKGFGRDSCVIALGGGVVGDLAGFVAATYMRGIPVVQVPTSLVAMVDASIGGKTGLDVEMGKNMVGAFHPPKIVLSDLDVLKTLPREERVQGLVEAVKHAAIMDCMYLDELENSIVAILDGNIDSIERVVARSIEIKAEVVSDDERESGRREILNFGHTLGHAIEGTSTYVVPHGTSVAIGMFFETLLGEKLGITESGSVDRIRRIVEALGINIQLPTGSEPNEIINYLRRDKKARRGKLKFVFLSRMGLVYHADYSWSHPVEEKLVLDMLTSIEK
tara:strand:- start:34888 stop:36009 length:1122 start_codon:yes stop_codon:yes gene_type:complete